jgi:hypothetical protein
MMDGMGRPKPANAVAATMEPIVGEILADKKERRRDRRVDRYGEEMVTARQIVGRCGEAQGKG